MLKNKYFITLSYLVVILGLLIGTSLLLAPVERKNKIKLYEDKYEGFFEGLELLDVLDINDPIISEKIKATDPKGNDLTLYGAKLGNSYGDIELIIALDPNGNVIESKALFVDQTFSQDKLTQLIVDMKGKTISTPAGNVSGVTIGSKTIQSILSAIEFEHVGKLSFLERTYGIGAKTGKVEELAETGIISKQEVKAKDEVLGNIYILELTKKDEDGKTATMKVEANLNKDNKLISYFILNYESNTQDKNLISINDVLDLLGGK